jgi:hypothetical protein
MFVCVDKLLVRTTEVHAYSTGSMLVAALSYYDGNHGDVLHKKNYTPPPPRTEVEFMNVKFS